MVRLKRAYERAELEDGRRVLVERLWPRGLPKEEAHLDEWLRDIAPSEALRRWFHHDPERWSEFGQKYARELDTEPARTLLDDLVRRAEGSTVTLVYSARDEEHNNAVVLKGVIERRLRRPSRKATRRTEGHGPSRSHVTHGRH